MTATSGRYSFVTLDVPWGASEYPSPSEPKPFDLGCIGNILRQVRFLYCTWSAVLGRVFTNSVEDVALYSITLSCTLLLHLPRTFLRCLNTSQMRPSCFFSVEQRRHGTQNCTFVNGAYGVMVRTGTITTYFMSHISGRKCKDRLVCLGVLIWKCPFISRCWIFVSDNLFND